MLDYEFWEEESELLWLAISSVFISALLSGINEGSETLPSDLQPLVNYDTLNTDVLRYIQEHHYDLSKIITDTTQKQVQEIMMNWVSSGEPLSSLEQLLTPIFGENRANMIAITEITRAFAEGNAMAWMSTGFINQVRFNTSVDDRVCPICSPLNGNVYDVDDYGYKPPIHPRCRCFNTPIVNVDDVQAQVERILNS